MPATVVVGGGVDSRADPSLASHSTTTFAIIDGDDLGDDAMVDEEDEQVMEARHKAEKDRLEAKRRKRSVA